MRRERIALVGDVTYRLRVPPNVPAKQYWSVTVYDLTTGCFIRESPRVSLDSFDTKAQKNADGSVDVYFGPKPPAGKESNWLYTAPGQPWFTYFRFYVYSTQTAEISVRHIFWT